MPNSMVVVLAVDGSPQTERTAKYYAEGLHRETNQVVLTHVVELPDKEDPRDAMMSPAALLDWWHKAERESEEIDLKIRNILTAAGVQAAVISTRVERGLKPGQVIVRVANETDASMVVMGSRGMGTIRRTILGSVSDYVVHHCSKPVVVVTDAGR